MSGMKERIRGFFLGEKLEAIGKSEEWREMRKQMT